MEAIHNRGSWNEGKLVRQKPPSRAKGHLGHSHLPPQRACRA